MRLWIILGMLLPLLTVTLRFLRNWFNCISLVQAIPSNGVLISSRFLHFIFFKLANWLCHSIFLPLLLRFRLRSSLTALIILCQFFLFLRQQLLLPMPLLLLLLLPLMLRLLLLVLLVYGIQLLLGLLRLLLLLPPVIPLDLILFSEAWVVDITVLLF